MESPFNFPMALVSEQTLAAAAAGIEQPDGDAETPARLAVLENRASTSRRGGHKVTLGFDVDGTKAPIIQYRLDMN